MLAGTEQKALTAEEIIFSTYVPEYSKTHENEVTYVVDLRRHTMAHEVQELHEEV